MDKEKKQRGPQLQDLSIKCQCSVVRDGFKLNSKKKSKYSQILLQVQKKQLKIINTLSQKQTETFTFSINSLKAVHKKFISEGKVTLEFFHHNKAIIVKGIDVAALSQSKQVNSQIFIDNASQENLKILISTLIQLKNKSNPQPKIAQEEKKQSRRKVKLPDEEIINRKNLLKIIRNQGKPLEKIQKVEKVKIKKVKSLQLMNLPTIILNEIFNFCQLNLQYRLISKDFSQFILKNIINLKLKDQVDEASFNKLARWSINLECRMKNIKKLTLSDRYDFKELIQNQSKTLKFGLWKEITSKNIDQMKGLRIYCLQIPYQIKFPISHFHGLRLAQLRFKGKNITVKNSSIDDDQLFCLLNGITQLQAVQIPYISSRIFTKIKQPLKFKEFKIKTLNQKTSQWTDLTPFKNITNLWIQSIQVQGIYANNFTVDRKIEWPPELKTLVIGSYISRQILNCLPLRIQNLKLIGEQFRNRDLHQIYLPNIKVLDITECPLMNPECLESFQNITVYTSWDREKTQHANNFYRNQQLDIRTNRN